LGLAFGTGFVFASVSERDFNTKIVSALLAERGIKSCRTPDMKPCLNIDEASGRANAYMAAGVTGLVLGAAGTAVAVYFGAQSDPKATPLRAQAAFIPAPGGGAFVVTGSF
jgi:hypothetical protein